MKKFLSAILLGLLAWCAPARAQSTLTLMHVGGTLTPPPTGMVADGSPCSNISSGTSTLDCGPLTVTAGDLIVCNGGSDASSGAQALLSFSDPSNGVYNIVFNNLQLSSVINEDGIYQAYFQNAASGSYSITLAAMESSSQSIECQAFKNALNANVLDPGAVTQQKQQASASSNPTAGSTQTPTNDGELIFSNLIDGCTGTPTGGSGYTLLSGAAINCQWGEYVIQGTKTATNCPYTMASDTWWNLCAAYLPMGATGGITPLTGMYIDFSGGSNGGTPTQTTLNSGLHSSLSAHFASPGTITAITYVTGSLHNLLNSTWVNGTSYSGSETGCGGTGCILNYATGTAGQAVQATFQDGNGDTFGFATATMTYFFQTTLPTADSNSNRYSLTTLVSADTMDECNPQIIPTGSALTLGLEVSGALAAGSISISRNTVYEVQIQANTSAGNCTLQLFDTTGTQVGSTLSKATISGSHPWAQLEIGISGGESESSGSAIQYDNIRLSGTAAFPLPN